mgnify:CR=1 FL=1
MKYYNLPYLIIIALLLSSCIGPLYNPFPMSKLIARVGPPLKINSVSVEEPINTENEENINDDNSLSEESNNSLSEESNTDNSVEEAEDKIDLEVIDEKTIFANWLLNIKDNLILPPDEVVKAVNEKCLNGNTAQLVSFSSSEGKASAIFKCW